MADKDDDKSCRAIIGEKKRGVLPQLCGKPGRPYRGPNSKTHKYLCDAHKPTNATWFLAETVEEALYTETTLYACPTCGMPTKAKDMDCLTCTLRRGK